MTDHERICQWPGCHHDAKYVVENDGHYAVVCELHGMESMIRGADDVHAK